MKGNYANKSHAHKPKKGKGSYNRIEVIDHTLVGEGRCLLLRRDRMQVEHSEQDNGQTLKIFVTEE